jgi:hypothetical protein
VGAVNYRLLALTILVLAAAILFTGCSSSRKRGAMPSSLSDVKRKIENDDHSRRPLVVRDDSDDCDYDDHVHVTVIEVDDDDDVLHHCDAGPRRRRRSPDPDIDLVVGGTLLGGFSDRDIEASFSGGSIFLGGEVDGRWRGDLELSYRSLEPRGYVDFGAFPNQEEWQIGGNLRFYLNPPSRDVRVYTLIGLSVGELHWDYREPVEVISVDDWGYVTGHSWLMHDRITMGTVYIGGGLSFLRTPTVEVGANGRVGYQFYDDETRAGFFNDLFDPNGFGYVGLEVSFLP